MKIFFLLLLSLSFLDADEFDMFALIDEQESSFEEEKPFLDLEFKLNYQYNEITDNDTVAFINLKKETQNFMLDLYLVANDKEQRILIKELYYKEKLSQNQNIEFGRIDVKEGYAKAYNPTDYFRNNPSLTLSNDPKEKKDKRLGSLLFSYTHFLDAYVLRMLYSPKIETKNETFLSNKEHYGLYLKQTNAQNRASLYLSYSGIRKLSTSSVVYLDNDGINVGTNLSYIYSDFIYYIESSFKDKEGVKNQTTLGITHTSEYNIVSSLEYVYNAKGDNSASLFLASRASDVVVNLDINYIMWLNIEDKSAMAQLGFEYALSDRVQTNLALSSSMGNKESEYGRVPNDYELLFEAKYFF